MQDYQPKPDLLKDRVIMVTGAVEGVGHAVARAAARHGATVVLCARDEQRLEAVYDEIEADGSPEPASFPLDLRKADEQLLLGVATTLGDEFGRLDGLVHCATYIPFLSRIDDYDAKQWEQVIRINLTAPFLLTQACMPLLRAANDASVVFSSDRVGRRGLAYWGAYSAAKFGIEGLTQVLAEETRDSSKIRVNRRCRAPTRTRIHAEEQRRLSEPGLLVGGGAGDLVSARHAPRREPGAADAAAVCRRAGRRQPRCLHRRRLQRPARAGPGPIHLLAGALRAGALLAADRTGPARAERAGRLQPGRQHRGADRRRALAGPRGHRRLAGQAISQAGGIALARGCAASAGGSGCSCPTASSRRARPGRPSRHWPIIASATSASISTPMPSSATAPWRGHDHRAAGRAPRAFGAEVREVDGHDSDALAAAADGFGGGERPLAVIARTDPCRGIDLMRERAPKLHYVRFKSDAEFGAYRPADADVDCRITAHRTAPPGAGGRQAPRNQGAGA
jgi:NAD(P)-dependent dehydrogenase (short-subunit alcohol dehydrogenase family)